jgi:tetratricopeptide (TPR) repeat protein
MNKVVTGSLMSMTLAAWLVPAAVCAQQAINVDRILFEAVPLEPGGASPLAVSPAPRSASRISLTARQSADVRAVDAQEAALAVEQYLNEITETSTALGPYDTGLFQQYLDLGLAYQDQGQHEEAIEAFESAEYISRINNGLYSPDKFPVIERMIESYIATGDLQTANAKQQYLLYLNSQHFGDDSLEVVPALDYLGDWNMDTFFHALTLGNNVGMNINFGGRGVGGSNATPRAMATRNLFLAQSQYYQAIENMVEHRMIFDPKLLQLEQKLVEAIFLSALRRSIIEDPVFFIKRRTSRTGTRIVRDELRGNTMSYVNGRNAWERMLIYVKVNPAAGPEDIARTMLGKADWNMLFNRRVTALRGYAEISDYLQQAGVSRERIEAILHPALPVHLPEFTFLPHSRAHLGIAPEAEVEYQGYIDVSFVISRFGNAQGIRITGTSDNVTPTLKRRLVKVLHNSPFRPRLQDGEPLKRDVIQLRYYFAEV